MNIEPYSPEWYLLRKVKIGASDAATIMGMNLWEKPYDLMLEKLGLLPPKEMNERMQRGLNLENKARDLFYRLTKKVMLPKVVISKYHDFMFASLDGIDMWGKEILEIKCPGKHAHNMAKKGKVPSYYYPQLQHQLSVTGLQMAYYFSYDGEEEGAIVEVPRDDIYIGHLVDAEKEFFTTMLSFVDDKDLSKYYSFQCT